ncbi:MAG: class I SAM-dependent RNA methyltransferase [Kiritimatiellae bacterium]|nr:class I SAM-dependent RNA methyltransferase [Kiritimatiellia bacterium]
MISTVYIAKNVYGGDGLGRLGDGRVVFVPGAWAGEQVKAEIIEEKRNFVKARLVEIVEPSPERIKETSVIPGMVYASLSRKGEIAAKAAQLEEFFSRAKIPLPIYSRVHEFGPSLNYRNKAVYHYDLTNSGDVVIGYMLEKCHKIIDTPFDPLARPEINAALPEIRKTVKTLLTTGPISIRKETLKKGTLTVRWTNKTGVKWWIGEPSADVVLKETTTGLDFEVPAGGFYQINVDVANHLANTIKEIAKSLPLKRIVDLYCGVGVLGIVAAKATNLELFGIESGRRAVKFAQSNAILNKIENARFLSGEVRSLFQRVKQSDGTFLILDPPRGGLEKGVPERILNFGASYILYVSCDPATLVRDLRVLVRGYQVEKADWFDMFPRTARFETMILLRKK